MVTAIVYFDTSDPDGFIDALEETGPLFEGVDGFHGFETKRGVEDPDRFVLLVSWDSVAAHETWQRDNVGDFVGTLNPYLAAPPQIRHFA